eukprot:8480482-Ditylum_brightwellii.AAC.1
MVYFCQVDETLDIINQHEGYAQGFPLSAMFASLVLGMDDGWSETIAFMDNASNILLLEDTYWYLTELVNIGRLYGVILNLKKILTSVTGQSILNSPHTETARSSTVKPLAMLDKGEATDGPTIVRTPIGLTQYVQAKLDKIATTATTTTTTIFATILDPHMALQLYTESILQCFPFHMSTDVATYADIGAYKGAHHWNTSFAKQIEYLTCSVIQTTSHCNDLPKYVHNLSTLPIAQGRLGIFSPQ